MCRADGPAKRASRKQRLAMSVRHGHIAPGRIRQEKVRLVSVPMKMMRHMRVRPGSVLLKRVRHINNLPKRKPHEKDAFLDLNPPTTH